MYKPVSDLEYFQILVARESQIPLIEAATALAQDEYPGLDLESVLLQIDELSKGLAKRCKNASTEIKRLSEISDYFFRELGFTGNFKEYYLPENSFIHKVLETRRGIPISLAVIYIELARSVGLDASGVSFPGHFLIKIDLHDGQVVLDPCNGQSLSQEELQEKLQPYGAQFGLASQDPIPLAMFLQPASERDILLRMLRNLREIYRQASDTVRLKKVLNRILILDPENGPERRFRQELGA